MKVRIAELFCFVTFVALSLGAVREHTRLIGSIYFTATLAVLGWAGIRLIATATHKRAFWSCFFFIAATYLYLVHIPDEYGNSPSQHSADLTTQVLFRMATWAVTRDEETPPEDNGSGQPDSDMGGPVADPSNRTGGMFDVKDDRSKGSKAPEEFKGNLSLVIGSGETVSFETTLRGGGLEIIRIGHCAWAILLGWIAGHIGGLIYSRNLEE